MDNQPVINQNPIENFEGSADSPTLIQSQTDGSPSKKPKLDLNVPPIDEEFLNPMNWRDIEVNESDRHSSSAQPYTGPLYTRGDRALHITDFPGMPSMSSMPKPKEEDEIESENVQMIVRIVPEGIDRRIVGEVITKFEKKGFYLKGIKLRTLKRPKEMEKPPQPFVFMLWEGKNILITGRKIIRAMNFSLGKDLVNGNDGVEFIKMAIQAFFPNAPVSWHSSKHSWIYQ